MRPITLLATLVMAIFLSAAASAQDFPVTVDHAFGKTTIAAAPKRVVSLGLHEQDFLYALGVAPVGVREWWGDYPYATWPWAEATRKALGAEPAVAGRDEISLEWVLAQDPDLIIAIYTDLDQTMYDALSKIAPVVTSPPGFPVWGTPWPDELKQISLSVFGSTEKADAIIADLGGRIAKARADYPVLEGKSAAIVYLEDTDTFGTWGEADTATRFLTSFGMVFPPELQALAGDDSHIIISPENIGLLDLDIVVWPIDTAETRATIEAMPLYQRLDIAKSGRSYWLDDGKGVASGALSFQSPLSLGYLIDTMPSRLAAAADGDPATAVEAMPEVGAN